MRREYNYKATETGEEEGAEGIAVMGEFQSMKCLVVVVVSFLVVLFSVIVAILMDSHHIIEEGSVGIYYKFGALQDEVTHPGVHWKAPFVTTVEQVQVRPKTDTLNLMSTVTKDGITNTFNDVQVISKIQPKNLIKMVRTFGLQFRQALIFDRVKEELRIFCANHTIDEVYNVK